MAIFVLFTTIQQHSLDVIGFPNLVSDALRAYTCQQRRRQFSANEYVYQVIKIGLLSTRKTYNMENIFHENYFPMLNANKIFYFFV